MHPLEIPPELRVDKAEAERRRQWWEQHPPKAMATFHQQPREVDPDVAAFAAREEARKREAVRTRLDALRAKKAGHEPARQGYQPGFVWDPARGRFVDPNRIPRARYERIMAELPTDAHRKVFAEMYGPGAPARPRGIQPVESPVAKEAQAPRPAPAKGAAPDKHATLMDLLGRPQGATLQEIAAATGWKTHTAQARIGGVRKTHEVPVSKEARGTVYRLLTKE